MKTLTLGKKIALGFGSLLLITGVLGGMAIYVINSVRSGSEKLAHESVPEAQVAGDIETGLWAAQLGVRGYALAGDRQYLEEGLKGMDMVREHQEEGRKLVSERPAMTKLRDTLQTFDVSFRAYDGLIRETETRMKSFEAARQRLDESAGGLTASLNMLIDGQAAKLEAEVKAGTNDAAGLAERMAKLTLAHAIEADAADIRIGAQKSQVARDAKIMEEALKHFEPLDQKLTKLEGILKAADDLAQLAKVRTQTSNYREAMKQLQADTTALAELNKGRAEKAADLRTLAGETGEEGMSKSLEQANSASRQLAAASWVIIIGVATALVVGLVVAFVIIRSTSRTLSSLAESLDDGSNQVASAAAQVSAASQSLAEGSSEQAASLEETSSSLEEMSSMTQRNAENGRNANELARQARAAADTGAADMQAMNKAMIEIKNSSDEIGKIIKTIDEIAFQTNILALNAAVEAARAGEAGMGFAVVADEVRNLAQRCAQSAKETADKIETAITKTSQGVEISNKVTQVLQEIVGKVRQVDELVAEVATASQEQSQGITQVNTAVGQMDKVTQSNAANAEETASAAEELTAQAEHLKDSVRQLLELVGAQRTTSHAVQKSRQLTREKRTKPLATVAAAKPVAKTNGSSQPAKPLEVAVVGTSRSQRQELPLDGDFKDF